MLVWFMLAAPFGIAGCAIRPDPMTATENATRAQADYDKLTKDYVPLNGPLSLAEAIARALKYNYDSELSRVEQTLQEQQLDLAYATMLPKLAAQAGYTERSNDNAAKSISELTHQTSLDYSYSTTRDDTTAGLEFSWNMLDVGVGYFQARQQGYRALIAVERRRKVIDNIVKGVQDAFWKAAIAERLLPRLDPLMVQAQQMLEASREGMRRGLQPKAQALQFQQNILQVISQLRHMRTDLVTSEVRLSTYINVPVSVSLSLAMPGEAEIHRPTGINISTLEQYGLNYRPELREAAYQEKIERQDVYKEMVKMLPGVSILAGLEYDSNKLLYNTTWADIGLHATYNLVELVEGPPAIAAAKTSVEAAKVRRLALGVAVLTQVNLGYQQFLASIDDLSMATQIDDVAKQLAEVTANATEAEAQTQADRVRQALTAMAADYDRGRALGDVYTALADLYIAIGVDLVPPDVDIRNLNDLTQKIQVAIQPWEAGELPPINIDPPAADPAAPKVGSVDGAGTQDATAPPRQSANTAPTPASPTSTAAASTGPAAASPTSASAVAAVSASAVQTGPVAGNAAASAPGPGGGMADATSPLIVNAAPVSAVRTEPVAGNQAVTASAPPVSATDTATPQIVKVAAVSTVRTTPSVIDPAKKKPLPGLKHVARLDKHKPHPHTPLGAPKTVASLSGGPQS